MKPPGARGHALCAATMIAAAAYAGAAPAARPSEGSPPPGPSAGPGIPRPSDPLDAMVTVRVKDAPLGSFLDVLSSRAGISFVAAEGLASRRVTIFLKDVTVREALEALSDITGLAWRRIGKSSAFAITARSGSAPRRATRVIGLSHIPLQPVGADGAR